MDRFAEALVVERRASFEHKRVGITIRGDGAPAHAGEDCDGFGVRPGIGAAADHDVPEEHVSLGRAVEHLACVADAAGAEPRVAAHELGGQKRVMGEPGDGDLGVDLGEGVGIGVRLEETRVVVGVPARSCAYASFEHWVDVVRTSTSDKHLERRIVI